MTAKERSGENYTSWLREQDEGSTNKEAERQNDEFEPPQSHNINSITTTSDLECEQMRYHIKHLCQMRHTVASDDTIKGDVELRNCYTQCEEADNKCCETRDTASSNENIEQKLTGEVLQTNSPVIKLEVCNDATQGTSQTADVLTKDETIIQEVCDHNLGLKIPETKEPHVKDEVIEQEFCDHDLGSIAPETKQALLNGEDIDGKVLGKETSHRPTQVEQLTLESDVNKDEASNEHFDLRILEHEQILVKCESIKQEDCGDRTQHELPQAERLFIKDEIIHVDAEHGAFNLNETFSGCESSGGQLGGERFPKDASNHNGDHLHEQAISEPFYDFDKAVPHKNQHSPHQEHRLGDFNAKVETTGDKSDLEVSEMEGTIDIKAKAGLNQYNASFSASTDKSHIMQVDNETERFYDAETTTEPADDQPLLEPGSMELSVTSRPSGMEHRQEPDSTLEGDTVSAANFNNFLGMGECLMAGIARADEFVKDCVDLLTVQVHTSKTVSEKSYNAILSNSEQTDSTALSQNIPFIHDEDLRCPASGSTYRRCHSTKKDEYELGDSGVLGELPNELSDHQNQRRCYLPGSAPNIADPPITNSWECGVLTTMDVDVDHPNFNEHNHTCIVPPTDESRDVIPKEGHFEFKRTISDGDVARADELIATNADTVDANDMAYLDNHQPFGMPVGSDERHPEIKCEPRDSDLSELPQAKRRKRSSRVAYKKASRKPKGANGNDLDDVKTASNPPSAWRNPPEIIDLSLDAVYKYYCRPGHIFPRFGEGDVSIYWLNKGEKYTYQLHSNILARSSPWFAKTLKEFVPEPSDSVAETFSHSTGIKFRYEMKIDPETKVPNLWRASLTELAKPYVVLPNDFSRADNLVSTSEHAWGNESKTTSGHLNSTSEGAEDENGKHDYFEAYDNLLRVIYAIGPLIATKNISKTFHQAQALINVAEFCGSLKLVRPFINNHLCQYGQNLYTSIYGAPSNWLRLGASLECEPIFREALVHAVGRSDSWPLGSTQLEDLPASVGRLYHTKVGELMEKQDTVQHGIFNSSIYVDGNPIDPNDCDGSVRNTLRVVKMWHKYYYRCLAQINKFRVGKFDSRIYHVLRRGGDSYLPLQEVFNQLRLEHDCRLSREDEMQVCEDLAVMKRYAQKIVEPLLVNRSMLDPEEAGIEYLTCTEVRRDELPWVSKSSS